MKTFSTLAIFLFFAISAWGQSFSADLAIASKANSSKGLAKLQASNGKIYISVPPHGSGESHSDGFRLWGLSHNMWVDGQPGFAEMELYGFALLYLSFHPTSGDDLCGQYRTHIREEFAAVDRRDPEHDKDERHLEKLQCRTMGAERVGDRDTQKIGLVYEGEAKDSELVLYVVPQLHFVVKVERNGSWMMLQNIKEGPQPEELFRVPSSAQSFG